MIFDFVIYFHCKDWCVPSLLALSFAMLTLEEILILCNSIVKLWGEIEIWSCAKLMFKEMYNSLIQCRVYEVLCQDMWLDDLKCLCRLVPIYMVWCFEFLCRLVSIYEAWRLDAMLTCEKIKILILCIAFLWKDIPGLILCILQRRYMSESFAYIQTEMWFILYIAFMWQEMWFILSNAYM